MAGKDDSAGLCADVLAGDAAREEHLAFAGMLSAASRLIYEEPSAGMLEDLAASGVFDDAADEDAGELERAAELVGQGLRAARADGTEAVVALRREHLRLFVGVGEPEVPSWANFYLDAENCLLGPETLRVRALYRAWGVQLEHINAEPDDNLGLMLGFLSMLEAKAAGDDASAEMVGRIKRDEQTLLREHVLPWLVAWRRAGEKHATSDFYRGACAFTFTVVLKLACARGFSYKESSRSFVLRKDMK